MTVLYQVINNYKADSSISSGDKEKSSISNQDLQKLYSVEFKSQAYASFYTTTMEKDKSILSLSVAGVGFLITLLKLTNELMIYDMFFFIFAIIGYLTAIYCIISIFSKNSKYIIDIVQDKSVTLIEYQLKRFDSLAINAFYLGIVMSLLLGISTSSTLFIK